MNNILTNNKIKAENNETVEILSPKYLKSIKLKKLVNFELKILYFIFFIMILIHFLFFNNLLINKSFISKQFLFIPSI